MRTELTQAERGFVRWARVARLATIGPEGPHVVPVSTVLDGEVLVFATETETTKVRNIRADPRVALVFDEYVEDWDALRQVMVTGTARIVEEELDWKRGRTLLYEKYLQYEPLATIGREDTSIVQVTIDGVASSGF